MKQDNSSILRVILPVFFLSGAAGGIYEVIWTKQLLLIFGGTAFAVSTVLTSYMAGLAIGSLYIGRYIDKRPANPIGKFAALELGVGLCGILLLFALPLVTRLYSLSYSSLLPSFYLRNLIRFALCFVALVVPTILMGGTLPVLSKGLFSGERSFGLSIGSLYAINTFGAMFGAVLVGFLLLPRWGVASSTIAAASLNALVAVFAFSMGRRRETGAEPEAGEAQPGPQGASRRKSKERDAARGIAEGACADEAPPGWLLLAVAAAAGFTSMCYQIIFTRLLKLVFSNTVAAFTTILVAFLAGIGIGSLIVSRFSDRIARRALALGLIQIALAAAAIWSMPVVFDSLSILNRASEVSRGAGWHGYALSRLAPVSRSTLRSMPPSARRHHTRPRVRATLRSRSNLRTCGRRCASVAWGPRSSSAWTRAAPWVRPTGWRPPRRRCWSSLWTPTSVATASVWSPSEGSRRKSSCSPRRAWSLRSSN